MKQPVVTPRVTPVSATVLKQVVGGLHGAIVRRYNANEANAIAFGSASASGNGG